MAVGRASGENRAVEAVQQAISSRLLDITIDGARGILFNIMGGPNMTLFEVNEAASIIRETAHPDVNLIFGAVIDENMGDEVSITVIATGFDSAGADIVSSHPMTTTTHSPRRSEVSDLFSSQVADRDNIEIPAFLRRRG
jgi:cell division protein FtsZ